MPWVSGVYSRGYPSWSADAASNLPISATKFDTEDNDFAAGLNNCLTKDGLSVPTAAIIWALTNAQILQLNRGTDGNVFAIGRTGGTNNPVFTFAIADAGGLTISAGTGGLNMLADGAVSIAAPSAGNALTVTADSGNYAASFLGAATSGASYGVAIQAGTTAADYPLVINNAGGTRLYSLSGYGNTILSAATAGITLSVTGVAGGGSYVAQFVSGAAGTAANTDVAISRAGSTANAVSKGPNLTLLDTTNTTYSCLQQSGGQTELWQLNGSWNQVLYVPTTRGLVINAPASGNTLTLSAIANQVGLYLTGSSTTSDSYGINILAGTNSTDYAAYFQSQGGTALMRIYGDGGVTIGTPTGGDQGAGTLNIANALAIAGNPIYAGIPINAQAAAYTCVLADANKSILTTGSGGGTKTIPSNAAVPYPVGTAITFTNVAGSSNTIAINTDTMYFAPSGGTGSRTLSAIGQATAYKIAATTWIIVGTGLT